MQRNIVYWNPWWKSDFKGFNLIETTPFKEILQLAERKEAVFITGVRRCGKTSAMYFLIQDLLKKVPKENIVYLNLDDEVLQFELLRDIFESYKDLFPDLSGKIYVFLDEVQNIDEWERWVKNKIDSMEEIKFFITGSKSNILKKTSSLLTGRIIETEIYPLSFKDFLEFKGISSKKPDVLSNLSKIKSVLTEYLEFGGFPEVVLEKDKKIKYLLLKEYYENIKDKDIITYFGVKESRKFDRMSLFLISNMTKLLSASNIGNVCDLSTSIADKYIDYSEMMYLFLTLNHFNYSLKNQITMPRKIYSIDNGFFNSISFKFSSNIGRLMENLVFIELKRRKKEIYYYKNKGECDFVIKQGLQLKEAIQVCYEINDDNKKKEINGLKETMQNLNIKKGLIITMNQDKIVEGVKVIPLWKWLIDF